jgi:putative hydrolase of the HAD superfamily
MKKAIAITCVFPEIGGVPLTDGWDHLASKRAATSLKLELAGMEDRHHASAGASATDWASSASNWA